jgi:hypothetical protein
VDWDEGDAGSVCKNDERLDAAPTTRGRAGPGWLGGETGGRATKTTGFDLGT